ncbi:hypothetical protein SKM54_08865 [Acinetobacter faecalis]|uniref:hypothetical protein n=1 Tax=Acinetobacter faecalis TaxID=2665161 RepID=UPI002A91AD0E|nr:hypothetical protein [Acinetobacter faecalis]MDY6468466.1 hypothetical protein [Acinetobacter faecalis]MDY6482553.1 hypothetical protein [Acinetobacter faecalis]
MKKILVFIALLFSNSLYAQNNNSAESVDEDKVQTCMIVGLYAETAMKGRQNNVDKSEFLSKIDNAKSVSDVGKSFYKGILNKAYEWPIKNNEAEKKKSIDSFRQEFYDGCVAA